MFTSQRKSRPVSTSNGQNGVFPPPASATVNSNALAAATAIGNALKTGTPIPRSNSLQRTSSLQRASFQSIPKRSGSLLGLQGPPSQFQQHRQPQNRTSAQGTSTAQRTQSLTAASRYRQITPKPSSGSLSSSGKPKMIKKHIPGPYGLVTIEVPAEDSQQPVIKKTVPKRRTQSLTRASVNSSRLSSADSSSIRSSSSTAKRPTFADVKEDIPLDFSQPSTPPARSDQHMNRNNNNSLTFIQEEEDDEDVSPNSIAGLGGSNENTSAEKVQGNISNEELTLKEFKTSKESEESRIIDNLRSEQLGEQAELNKKQIINDLSTPDFENDVVDQYTDLPSTAKSNDSTMLAGHSSTTTLETDTENNWESKQVSNAHTSMAQQLRPTIPTLYVNNHDANGGNIDHPDFDYKQANEIPTGNSSIYSSEIESTNMNATSSNNTNASAHKEESEVPARSSKRINNVSPRKSALKITASTSSVHLPATKDSNSPANAAYLSLTTAENTRLNATMSSSNLSTPTLNRSPSHRARSDSNGAGRNNIKPQQRMSQQIQPPQYNPNQTGFIKSQQRPMSTVEASQSNGNPRMNRPQSAQGFGQQRPTGTPRHIKQPQAPSQQQPLQQQHHQALQHQQKPLSVSNAAALNAAKKRDEHLRPNLEKKSSFEKERPAESHSAFKRKSLRDPSMSSNSHNVESNLGFYRHQAQQQSKHPQPQQTQAQQQHPSHQPSSNLNLEGFSHFKSRFNDSDSDLDVPISSNTKKSHAGFAPPPSNPSLRKPKSTYTLRSSSVNNLHSNGDYNSPAKSLPEKRATRYFSETDKEQLFHDHLEKVKNGETKKKSGFGGKLKKLFGRSHKD